LPRNSAAPAPARSGGAKPPSRCRTGRGADRAAPGLASPDRRAHLGLISLTATAAVWRAVGAGDVAGPVQSALPALPRWRWNGASARLVCCYGGFGFGYIIPATFLPVMAREIIRDPTIFGWCWPVFGAAAAGHPPWPQG